MKRGTPEMRAFALLGLAGLKDRASTAEIAAIAKSREAEQDSLPLSSILPRDEHGHAVIPEEV